MSAIEQIRNTRPIIEQTVQLLDDTISLALIQLHPEWSAGAVHRCIRDTVNPVHNALSELADIYVEVF